MNFHEYEQDFVLEILDTNKENGLSAYDAAERLSRYGENRLTAKKKSNILVRFLAQFNDFMVLTLISAAVIAAVISNLKGEQDFTDSIIILIIVSLNAVLGLVQENRAEKALEALKKMSSPMARVLRDGQIFSIDTALLVPGDIIFLESGDFVPADARLLEAHNLQAEESALTGESLPAEKDAGAMGSGQSLGDMKNTVFSGSGISRGRAVAVVTRTGMETEVGKIARMLTDNGAPQTPLKLKLEKTGKLLGIGALIICGLIFIIGLYRNVDPFEMFMTSVSLAVAAIPEGLPAIVTIVLAIGVQRMVRRNAIVRRLPSVETLGQATVICSDKTGTLTQNKMTVTEITSVSRIADSDETRNILRLSALCADSAANDPTETAILNAAKKNGIYKEKLDADHPRIGEIPFDSERKLMTVFVEGMAVTKGAPDLLLKKCSHYELDGKTAVLDGTISRAIHHKNSQMAGNGLRVLGVAYKKSLAKAEFNEEDLVFIGLIGMMDPPKPEVKDAVSTCKQAGIKPVMITGDHVLTAVSIAREIGIMGGRDRAVTGAEIDAMDDNELSREIDNYNVFARVTPTHKTRIVRAFQANGEVVAMTGDGVNDAPALKAADIGCAMGIAGTDVAKGAADMILTDDNFATIVQAVSEGRSIYDNIKKSIHFLLSSNIGEIITILAAILMGFETPLLAIHLLWVNLVTDSLPAIALGMDPSNDNVMTRKPVRRGESLFSGGLWQNIAFEGVMIGMLALTAYGVGAVFFDQPGAHAIGRTMAFATLSISQLVHAFNMRSEKSIFSINMFENRWLIGAFFAGLALQVSVIMIKPLTRIFKVTALAPSSWLVVLLLCLMPILIVEFEKFLSALGSVRREVARE